MKEVRWLLDHVFFATAEPDTIEQELAVLGFDFTARRRHEGQGTANACAVFDNAFFEILWCVDSAEITSDLVRPLGLDERVRWRETGACPVGLCFRSVDGSGTNASWPFDTWDYEPRYAKGRGVIPIVTPPGCLSEPLIFLSPAAQSRSVGPEHGGKKRLLRSVGVGSPVDDATISLGVKWFLEQSLFSLSSMGASQLRWEFGPSASSKNSRLAAAPIEICW